MKYDNCCPCSVVPVPGHRILTFADGSESGVIGLDSALEDMWRAGKPPDSRTASQIVDRLSEENYVAAAVRPLYEEAALHEYQQFLETAKAREADAPLREAKATGQKPGLFRRLVAAFHGGKG